jgi:carboxypeptidase Q
MRKVVQVVLIGGFVVLFAGFRATDKKWEKPFSRLDNEVRKNSKAYETLGDATNRLVTG